MSVETEAGALSPEQQARAEAVVIAARVLGKRVPMSTGSSLPEDRSVVEVTDLAEYVLSGRDPLQPFVGGEAIALDPVEGLEGLDALLAIGGPAHALYRAAQSAVATQTPVQMGVQDDDGQTGGQVLVIPCDSTGAIPAGVTIRWQ